MGSPWKALSDDSRRQILLLLKRKEMTPSQISEHFEFKLASRFYSFARSKRGGFDIRAKTW
ncbi:ArsR family transcriptional regulator [Candidatus Nitrosotenuis chungbukensis]|uniref:ArsR family transcriptional regulator n=1 Tax=Candidatus Nitrosotenuis chungbukensis TaxID=1353246 RepID=UPI003B967E13